MAATTPASIFSGRALSRRERLTIALLVAVAASVVAAIAFHAFPSMLARDFSYPWRGAVALLEGQDPYHVIRPVGDAPFDMWFMYPLTASLAVLPLAFAPVQMAGVIFTGVGAALLTYALSVGGMGRLWLLLSVPMALSVTLAQWSPVLIAAALLTPLAWALTCKPIGLALFLWQPRWRSALLCAAFISIAFAVQPNWLMEWMRNAATVVGHQPPVVHPLGAFALLALIRWRRPEARLVAAMALIPQNLYFYDQLPLLLVARNGRTAFILSALSWVAWGATAARCDSSVNCGPEAELPILALMYVPATAMVLFDDAGRAWCARQWRRLQTRHR